MRQVLVTRDSDLIPITGFPLERVKLHTFCPPPVDSCFIDQFESLELMKSDFENDTEELERLRKQQLEIRLKLVFQDPAFHSID